MRVESSEMVNSSLPSVTFALQMATENLRTAGRPRPRMFDRRRLFPGGGTRI